MLERGPIPPDRRVATAFVIFLDPDEGAPCTLIFGDRGRLKPQPSVSVSTEARTPGQLHHETDISVISDISSSRHTSSFALKCASNMHRKRAYSRANRRLFPWKDPNLLYYVPELPKPFSARTESSSVSTSWTGPVRTGTGIIWAIFSPALSSIATAPRLVISTRISPR